LKLHSYFGGNYLKNSNDPPSHPHRIPRYKGMKKKILSDYAAFFGLAEDEIRQFSRLLEDERGFRSAVDETCEHLANVILPQIADGVLCRHLLRWRAVSKGNACFGRGVATRKVALAMAVVISDCAEREVFEGNGHSPDGDNS